MGRYFVGQENCSCRYKSVCSSSAVHCAWCLRTSSCPQKYSSHHPHTLKLLLFIHSGSLNFKPRLLLQHKHNFVGERDRFRRLTYVVPPSAPPLPLRITTSLSPARCHRKHLRLSASEAFPCMLLAASECETDGKKNQGFATLVCWLPLCLELFAELRVTLAGRFVWVAEGSVN